MIINPGLRRAISGTLRLSNIVRQIFAGGINGAIYDLSRSSHLNQLNSGTAPVTTVTNPVGLMLDSRLGLALGPEIAPSLAIAIPYSVNGTVSASANSVLCTCTTNGAYGFKYSPALNAVVGTSYTTLITKATNSANRSIYSHLGGATANLGVTPENNKSAVHITVSSTAEYLIYIPDGLVGESFTITFVSIKTIDGNHAIQATAAARPTWQVDASGKYYLSFLGVDDALTSATGGGGTAGFFFCCAIQPTGGAVTLRTLFADNGTNTGYKVQIDASNKLSFSAGNGAAFTTKASTATIDVGTKYLLTVYDDGTNLNVQINNATVETVARPVVSAGTAGFTLAKDNGAASSFFIGNLYPSVYLKNTAGTAAERAVIQAWVKSQAGL